MELKVVRYEVDRDGVALVTLDRPHRLNAWTGRMEQEYRWVLAEADRDPAVRVAVVTGAGRAFCAGADSAALEKEAAAGTYDTGVREPLATPGAGVRPDYEHEHTFPLGMRKPVIAAINGPAAGVGLVLACFCDVRFAAAGAKLTAAHGRLGLPAEMAISWILPRIVGAGHAADMLLSSRVVLAEEAERMGLVNRVLPGSDVVEHAVGYARQLATEVSPRSLEATKRQLWAGLLGDLDASASDARRRLEEMMGEPDFKEGVAALLEKRRPQFPPLEEPPTAR